MWVLVSRWKTSLKEPAAKGVELVEMPVPEVRKQYAAELAQSMALRAVNSRVRSVVQKYLDKQ